MDLFTALQNFKSTENGALTFASSGSRVLDLFGQGGAYRTRSEVEVTKAVSDAFMESPLQTVETLLYLRDIRGGQGEKRVFQIGISALKDIVNNLGTRDILFDAIIEVGSWKDIFKIFTFDEWKDYVNRRIKFSESDKPDLMYKWLPSIGGSQNKIAEKLATYLGMTPKQYRKMLTAERAKIKLVETQMCANEWNKVDYEHLPSRAGFLYRNAFGKHDRERYTAYIAAANRKDGSVKMNTGTLYPYEIVERYKSAAYFNSWGTQPPKIDPQLEAFWKNLPDYGTDGKNALVVADTSGSMYGRPMDISTSLAIYFSEHNKGIFRNKYITFAGNPQFYSFKEGEPLGNKLDFMYKHEICDNTNIQKVFDLVLKAAITNHIPEEEMPEALYIISDMEFDEAQGYNSWRSSQIPKTNFEEIKRKYVEAGYKMPKLIFWNVDARQNNSPVTMNEVGVALVSGSSPSTFEMAVSGDLNPMKFMLQTIEKARYADFAKAILKM